MGRLSGMPALGQLDELKDGIFYLYANEEDVGECCREMLDRGVKGKGNGRLKFKKKRVLKPSSGKR
jgi:hypothetical protein